MTNSISLKNLINSNSKPRNMILAPWLTAQSLNMIFAPRGIGKTHVSLGIAYAVASGGNFLRWHADEPEGVLFVDSEMTKCDLKKRLKNIMDNADKKPQAIFTILTPDMQPNGIMPDLSTEEGRQEVEKFITDDIKLIILDNLSSLMKEKPNGWLEVQTWLLHLRSLGKSIIIIHHANKEGKQRGTSRREDALDNVIDLKKPKDYSPEQGSRFIVTFEKARSLFGKDVIPFEAWLKNGQQWETKDIDKTENNPFLKIIPLKIQPKKPTAAIAFTSIVVFILITIAAMCWSN